MKFYYVYKTIQTAPKNRIGKYYIGKRSCKNIQNDVDYLGSGKLIKLAVNKYGKECFKKEILCFCKTEDEAYKIEKRDYTLYIR